MLRFYPVTEPFFLEGGLKSTFDLVKKEFQGGSRLFFYGGAGKYTGMGYQGGDIVFDPRDIHYSLNPGFRYERGNFIYDANLLHDCFHDIDRMYGLTEIWNVIRFEFMTRNFFPAYRRAEVLENYRRGFVFEPNYSAAIWYFPWWGHQWVQHAHEYLWAAETGVNLSFYRHDRFSAEFRGDARVYLDKQRDIDYITGLYLYAIKYGSHGTVAIFGGWLLDRQSIKPRGNKLIAGVRFYH